MKGPFNRPAADKASKVNGTNSTSGPAEWRVEGRLKSQNAGEEVSKSTKLIRLRDRLNRESKAVLLQIGWWSPQRQGSPS